MVAKNAITPQIHARLDPANLSLASPKSNTPMIAAKVIAVGNVPGMPEAIDAHPSRDGNAKPPNIRSKTKHALTAQRDDPKRPNMNNRFIRSNLVS